MSQCLMFCGSDISYGSILICKAENTVTTDLKNKRLQHFCFERQYTARQYTALQSQKAVYSYLWIKQMLPLALHGSIVGFITSLVSRYHIILGYIYL